LVMKHHGTSAIVVAVVSLSAALGVCTTAWGDSLPPNPADLIRALKATGKARGMRVEPASTDVDRDEKRKRLFQTLKRKGTRGLSVEERDELLPAVVVDRPSVDLEVYFDYNSAAITERAKPALASLGEALQDKELKGQNFLLAGHTDAKGGEEYNQELSERRAMAVKSYLADHYDVPEFELVPIGYGEDKLKFPQEPYDSRNRRVQVVNMGESAAAN